MKVIVASLVLVLWGGIYLNNEPGLAVSASAWWRDLLYKKDIHVYGAELLAEDEVLAMLPLERSTLWWLLHRETVLRDLLRNPLVKRAELGGCSMSYRSWGCFELLLEEREPHYLAQVGNNYWIVDKTGSFIGVLPEGLDVKEAALSLSKRFGDIKILNGLGSESAASSDTLVKARFSYASKAVLTIEKASGMKVQKGELLPDGELMIRFAGYPFKARFSYVSDNREQFRDESYRLMKILAQFRGREKKIRSIDLAFNKLAVVRTF